MHVLPMPLRVRTAGPALAALLALSLFAIPAKAQPYQYTLDPSHTYISFGISHIGFAPVIGLFGAASGSFVFDEAAVAVSDVHVTVEADSVYTAHTRRDHHVRDKDFLDVANHPEITFVGRETTRTGDRTGTITGDLTLLGVTRPVTFALTWNKSGYYPWPGKDGTRAYVVGVTAKGSLRRSDFGMTYGVEGGLVGDTVDLTIGFEGIRGQPVAE